MPGNSRGEEIANQLIEVALRVDAVRPFSVETMLSLLFNDRLVLGQARKTVQEVLKAAAWIVGEYSEIVSHIVNDVAIVEEDEEQDDEEEGYWIEGPNGDEIMSSWRGQDIHVMAIDALLHPRATTLPSHVLSTYIQSAMKMFLRACADCNDDQLAEIVGIVRSRLGVFLLNDSIEVQERASTFKNVLHELGILSTSWESDIVSMQEFANQQKGGLLDMVVSGSDSVRSIDLNAVKEIIKKRKILLTIVAEPFYSVHSKAQKRVPVPEGLDLSVAFNPAALDAIMALDGPKDIQISKLSFLAPIPSTTPFQGETSQRDALEEARLATLKSSFQQSSYEDDDEADTRADGFNSIGDNQLFYLGRPTSDAAPDERTLAKILGDFEDSRPRRRKDKGKKSKSKKGKADVDVRDMVPVGMADSDDEGVTPVKQGRMSRKSGVSDVRFQKFTVE